MKTSITDIPKKINISDKKLSIDEILNYVNTTSAHVESQVILFEDTEDTYTLKLNWVDKNKWKVDYPITLHKIHRQRYVSLKQCLQVIEVIYTSNDIYSLKGFYDVPIEHFTLDEMIEFKKEDEMMLRGQNPYEETTSETTSAKQPPKQVKKIGPVKEHKKPTTLANLGDSMDKTKTAPKSIKKTTLPKNKPKNSGDNSFFQI